MHKTEDAQLCAEDFKGGSLITTCEDGRELQKQLEGDRKAFCTLKLFLLLFLWESKNRFTQSEVIFKFPYSILRRINRTLQTKQREFFYSQ